MPLPAVALRWHRVPCVRVLRVLPAFIIIVRAYCGRASAITERRTVPEPEIGAGNAYDYQVPDGAAVKMLHIAPMCAFASVQHFSAPVRRFTAMLYTYCFTRGQRTLY